MKQYLAIDIGGTAVKLGIVEMCIRDRYVSALGNVDQSIVEAAEVDGATDFQCFWKIKWPAIMPTTLYILVITTINSFQCFALIQLLTSGGPNHSTDTIMYYIYYTCLLYTSRCV